MSAPFMSNEALQSLVDTVVTDTGFAGLVEVSGPDRPPLQIAVGLADRRWSVPFTVTTRAAIASGTKGFTGLAVMALVETGTLGLDTTARVLLADDLPLVDDDVTIEHLLSHTSGIGDYLDEEQQSDISDYAMPIPVHQLHSAESYLAVLDGHPQVSPPGERFVYNNGAFVLLGLLAERAAGRPYEELIRDLVCTPAGLTDTGFVRADSLPPGAATGYLDATGLRANNLHMPLLGCGDGGMYTTLDDMSRFWTALYAGQIVSAATTTAMTTPGGHTAEGDDRYGLAFWLAERGPTVYLEGYDAGVSFRSLHDPETGLTQSVIANTSEGAWPMLRALRAELGPA